MMGNTAIVEWQLALKQMQKVALRLRWSYVGQPHANLKNYFLYCAMLSEDAAMPVETMAHIWIAEGLVKTKEDADYDYVLKTGESYVKLLENRCLFQVEEGGIRVQRCYPLHGNLYWRE
jgi:hypothetical protein